MREQEDICTLQHQERYNSLLVRGDPILYFEIDYSVKSAKENEPSKYSGINLE